MRVLDEIIADVPKDKIFHREPAGVIICADCLEILPLLPDKSVDLVLTDPPYGLDWPYLSYNDTVENLKKLLGGALPEIFRVGNLAGIFSSITNMFLHPQPDWIISIKWNTTGSYGKFGVNQWIPLLMYGKDIDGFGSVNGIIKSDVIEISGGSGVGFMRKNGEAEHPCPKPFNVIKKSTCRLSFESNIILDPFLGSGTSAHAAKQLGRKFVGIEIEPRYAQIAVERLRQEILL